MRYLIIILSAVFLFTACQKAETPPQASPSAKRYNMKGKVVAIDKAKKKATIAHEDIPGFMEAMTMDFPIHETWVWEDLQPGSEIFAELVVDNTAQDTYWLEKIGIIAAPNPNQPAVQVDERFAQIGNEVPDFTLTNQDGKRISLRDYRGKALAITFIYSRCPLPNFCIAMSKNFSDLALQLKDNAEMKDKIRLLTVSFDPQTDTPEKLRQYGLGYLGKNENADFTVWQLAVGSEKEVRGIADFFGLRYEISEEDKTQFNHSLRTAVISPDGKVTKILPGSDWTPNDLLREMQKTF
ncbi:MAG: Electron transport protein SCO1/SenC [Acidobacteria bacterium]|jgi:protein SCO1/2|nr:Electron transport protein SCO1/SenC [Acidobacteriota bacterium]